MKSRKHKYRLVPYTMFAALALLQGCIPNLPLSRSDNFSLKIPENFPAYKIDENIVANNPKTNLAKQNWKLFFNDPKLVELIEIALKNNQELRILEQEINIANNEIMARQGEYLPRLGFSADYEHEKVGEFTSQGASDALARVPEKLNIYKVGFVASWEVDIWKKLRNATQSAYLEYLASIEAKNYATTRLLEELAVSYYELLALDKQLNVVEQFVGTLQKGQQVVEYQKQAARTTSLAVKRFSSEVLKSQSRKYQLQQNILIVENRINTLLGRMPQKIARSPLYLTNSSPQDITTGLPVNLLDNRPDIKQASLELEAAKVNVQSVKAKFYPALSIEAGAGFASFKWDHFISSPTSVFYNIAAGITAPLLNRMKIEADYKTANSRQIQAIYDYERTFIQAYVEVLNQLANIENLKQIYILKDQQVKALSESVEISGMLFKSARVDYLESLLSQRDFLETQMELIETRQRQFRSQIALYKALGGGWK